MVNQLNEWILKEKGLCRSRNKNEILLGETNYKNEEESIKGNPFRAPIFSL